MDENLSKKMEKTEQEQHSEETKSPLKVPLENVAVPIEDKVVENNNQSKSDIKTEMDEASLVSEVKQLNISDNENINRVVVVNKHSESLRSLLVYDSDNCSGSSSDDDDDEEDDETTNESNVGTKHEEEDDDDDDDEEDSSSSSSSSSWFDKSGVADDDDEDEDVDDEIVAIENHGAIKKNTAVKKKDPILKVPGELTLEELPPVPDPSTLVKSKCLDYLKMGRVENIMDYLVTIESLPNIPAYDLETMLFIGEDKTPLGQVFDVVGPVCSPIYVIRFNSFEEISKLKLQRGMDVYSAPKSDLTQYVFVKELLKIKGTDASGMFDKELPVDLQDFSDDEVENISRTGRARLQMHSKRSHSSPERHRHFEHLMNQCNNLNTRVHHLIDNPHKAKWIRKSEVVFDPSIPPPGFPTNPGDQRRQYFGFPGTSKGNP